MDVFVCRRGDGANRGEKDRKAESETGRLDGRQSHMTLNTFDERCCPRLRKRPPGSVLFLLADCSLGLHSRTEHRNGACAVTDRPVLPPRASERWGGTSTHQEQVAVISMVTGPLESHRNLQQRQRPLSESGLSKAAR